jgi:hypothetical protein
MTTAEGEIPSFLYFQSVVQYRIPIKNNGTAGKPEVLAKFTAPYGGTQNQMIKRSVREEKTEMKEEYL